MFRSRGIAAIWFQEQKKFQILAEGKQQQKKPRNSGGKAKRVACASHLDHPRVPTSWDRPGGLWGIWSREDAGEAGRRQAQMRRNPYSSGGPECRTLAGSLDELPRGPTPAVETLTGRGTPVRLGDPAAPSRVQLPRSRNRDPRERKVPLGRVSAAFKGSLRSNHEGINIMCFSTSQSLSLDRNSSSLL